MCKVLDGLNYLLVSLLRCQVDLLLDHLPRFIYLLPSDPLAALAVGLCPYVLECVAEYTVKGCPLDLVP